MLVPINAVRRIPWMLRYLGVPIVNGIYQMVVYGPRPLADVVVWRLLVPRGAGKPAAAITRRATYLWMSNPAKGANIVRACALLHRRATEEDRAWLSDPPTPEIWGPEDHLLRAIIAAIQGDRREVLERRKLLCAYSVNDVPQWVLFLADISTAMCVESPWVCRMLRPVRRRLFPTS